MPVLNRLVVRSSVAAAALFTVTLAPVAQERDRAKVPDKYKWNLTDIYPSDEAWSQAKEKLSADLAKVQPFKGKLGGSASQLADALDLVTNLSKELGRLFVYASMSSDTDTRVGKYQAMRQ